MKLTFYTKDGEQVKHKNIMEAASDPQVYRVVNDEAGIIASYIRSGAGWDVESNSNENR